ncbi:MAG: HAMP domain-containing histidine kinase [Burkholderiales bacterium]|nr:HAMP domain-containing histidine kinase [Burkholderiales bacterium]
MGNPTDTRSPAQLLEAARQQMFSGQADPQSPMTQLGQLALERAREAGDARTEAMAQFYALQHRVAALPSSEAEELVAAAEGRCSELGMAGAGRMLQVVRANMLFLRKSYIEAISLLSRLHRNHAAEIAPLERAALLYVLAYSCRWCGRFDDALEHSYEALRSADESGYRYARAAVRINLSGTLLAIALDPEAALPLADEAREMLAAGESTPAWMRCLSVRIEALDLLGRPEEAYAAYARDGPRVCSPKEARGAVPKTAMACIGVGRLEEAEALLGSPLQAYEYGVDWTWALAYNQTRLRLLCARRQYAQARELAESELARLLPHASEPLHEARMYDMLREARAALGDHQGAVAAAIEARRACLPVIRLSTRARYLVAQLQAGGSGAASLSAIDLRRLQAVEQAIDAQQAETPPAAATEGRVPPFVAHVVHELRNPIGSVMGMASLLMMSELDEPQRRYARLMQRSAQTLTLLVNDILDLAKLERGQFTLAPRLAAFEPWLRATVEPFVDIAALKQLRLEWTLDPALPGRLEFDELRLRQVVSNLLSNAVKFTRQGWIRLDVARTPATGPDLVGLRFEVRDSGFGIPAEAIGHLFQEFVQADPSVAREHGGSGLGLALSKQLIERMGGRIGVDSEPGVGSRFWLELELASRP